MPVDIGAIRANNASNYLQEVAMRCLPILLVAAFIAGPAQAKIVRHEFTARVSSMLEAPEDEESRFVNSSSMAGATVSVSDTWTGAFYYDTELTRTAYEVIPYPGRSRSWYEGYRAVEISDPETGFVFNSGHPPMYPDWMFVEDVSVNFCCDRFAFTATGPVGPALEIVYINLSGAYGVALDNSNLPDRLDLETFRSGYLSYHFRNADGDNLYIATVITSLTPPPIPEPSTYAMLGLGLAALAMTKRLCRD